MGKEALYDKGKKGYINYILGFVIGVITAAVFIVLFALIMFFWGAASKYAPVFATVSVGAGCFDAAFFTAKKQGNRGWLAGAVIGGITFVLITLVSIIINTHNRKSSLFHFAADLCGVLIHQSAESHHTANKYCK